MAVPRRKFREIVLQLLFSENMNSIDFTELVSFLSPLIKITKKTVWEAYTMVKKIQEKQKEIDKRISQASKEYDFHRISLVEKNILRIGVFELFYEEDIPKKVAIAEAIRLCRKFGTRQSATFINALLDSLKDEEPFGH